MDSALSPIQYHTSPNIGDMLMWTVGNGICGYGREKVGRLWMGGRVSGYDIGRVVCDGSWR